jgi:hypothetical protein
MKTGTEIRVEGMNALANALGDMGAEKFVALLQREPFDYTRWQRSLADNGDAKAALRYVIKPSA